jgi:hypothetical protein
MSRAPVQLARDGIAAAMTQLWTAGSHREQGTDSVEQSALQRSH